MNFKPLFLLLFALLLWPLQTYALSSDWQQDETARVRLVSATDGVGKGETVALGLEVELAEGWHTYWRSPGAAGLPPQIDWQGSLSHSGNLKEATLSYPAPKRYTAYGLETIGYTQHVVFPIEARLRMAGHELNLDASVDLLVCSTICVPKHYALKLTVPEGAATESPEAELIRQAYSQIPGNAESSGLVIQNLKTDGENLIVVVQSRDSLRHPDLFVENDRDLSFTAPAVQVADDQHSAQFTLKPADTLPEGTKLAGMKLTLTVTDETHALEEKVVVPSVSGTPPVFVPPPLPLGAALLFALIGGFILNLMPCVLPVLSLKIISVVSHGGGDKTTVRRSFLISAAGILFSFMVLAGLTIALKALGLSFGWGVQFQQPVFLVFLIVLLTFFAANMWGLFEIMLPDWLADSVNQTSYHPKLAGDFATGAFATLLATPCTAPFLGTAVGFALSSGAVEILLIFAALGVGMILPYLAIALFPRVAIALPKPGVWMLWLRRVMGGALAATALWLTWVLAAQITPRLAAFVGLCMAAIVLLLALRRSSLSRRLIFFCVVIFIVLALALTFSGSLIPKQAATVDALWLPFSEQALAADMEEGKTVFVDITADWCLTCKANKKLILSDEAVSQRLFHSDIVAMQADWTNPDPVIATFLHKYGRYGIPFNAVFGPGAKDGILLPELLTDDLVNQALDQAARLPAPP